MTPQRPAPTRPRRYYERDLFEPAPCWTMWEKLPQEARQEAVRLLTEIVRQFHVTQTAHVGKGVTDE